MLLAIDIGNTNIVFGLQDGDKWANHWRIQTDSQKTADEYEVIFRSLLGLENSNQIEISKVIFSSVVPSLVLPFTEMLTDLFPKAGLFRVEPGIYGRLPVKVLNPSEIGTDLVANAVAAFNRFGNNTMIVDFGTALTFTTINEKSEIVGVAIAPGLQTAVGALAGKTAQLPQIHLNPPPSVLGDNTVHAIQSGIVYGFTGLVDSIIERTQNEMGSDLNIVATGGLSTVIAPLSKYVSTIDKMLTLEGLKDIFQIVSAG